MSKHVPITPDELLPYQRGQYDLIKAHEHRPTKPGVYLYLMHGRKDPEQDMDDWGLEGPYIGPLRNMHTTYASTLHLKFADGKETGPLYPEVMCIADDMLYWDGVYYGDWSVFYVGD